jgi:hypothetical protein
MKDQKEAEQYHLTHSHLENNTILHFEGIIQYETIGELIHTFKQRIHAIGVQVGTYKRILLVMIEVLENIMKHSEGCPEKSREGHQNPVPVFSIRKSDNQFVVISSNPIKGINIQAFKNQLDFLNTLDQQGLKEFYKRTITNGLFTNRGGAGLGLIEIAKISGNRIIYAFEPVDEHCYRFDMTVTINDSKN